MATIPKTTKVVIWDLDGTILDSFNGFIKILEIVLPKHNRPVPSRAELARNYHGTVEEIFMGLMPNLTPQQLKTIIHDFIVIDNDHIEDVDAYLFEDATELAKRIHAESMKQIIVTNRQHGKDRGNSSPRTLIENSGLSHIIEKVICGDEGERRKPDVWVVERILEEWSVTPEDTVVIGDQFVDGQLAMNLGGKAFLVNRHDRELAHLERLGPDYQSHVTIVPNLNEIGVA